jgi:hypothetical protein
LNIPRLSILNRRRCPLSLGPNRQRLHRGLPVRDLPNFLRGRRCCYRRLSFRVDELICSSDGFCSCWDIWIYSADAGSLEVREVSATSGTSGYGTIHLACFPDHSRGNTTLLHSANSSVNSAPDTMGGSGLTARHQYNRSLRFCTLSRNAPRSCLSLFLQSRDGHCEEQRRRISRRFRNPPNSLQTIEGTMTMTIESHQRRDRWPHINSFHK